MKRLFHVCISSPDEVLFRCAEDYSTFVNCLALALFKTETDLYADSVMSNHVHLSVMANDLKNFVRDLRIRYSMYFNAKYKRRGRHLRNRGCFFLELEGDRHILAAWSYIFRNGLHHGQCANAFGYAQSSVNSIFRKELGKPENQDIITSRPIIQKCLPRYSEFPDTYVMDKNGMFTRESITQTTQVEMRYVTPRAFLFYMNRLTNEDWYLEQKKDNNDREPITLEVIEKGAVNTPLKILMSNEYGRYDQSRRTDMDVCITIDAEFVRKCGKSSVYELSPNEKKRIADVLQFEYHLPQNQIRRCLVL